MEASEGSRVSVGGHHFIAAELRGMFVASCAGRHDFARGGRRRRAQFTVTPLDERGADGVPDVVAVESPFYKFRFILWEAGSADSLVYKPLNHEFRRGELLRATT